MLNDINEIKLQQLQNIALSNLSRLIPRGTDPELARLLQNVFILGLNTGIEIGNIIQREDKQCH